MEIKNNPNHPKISIGNYIIIKDFSNIEPNIAVKLCTKIKHRVIDVDKHPVGENGNYHWEYSIYIQHCKDILLPGQYCIFK